MAPQAGALRESSSLPWRIHRPGGPTNLAATHSLTHSMTATGADPSIAHLLAELERIDLLLRAAAERARQRPAADQDLRGLFIAEEEVDGLVNEPAGLPHWAAGPAATVAGEQRLAERRAGWHREGATLRLEELSRLFGLSPFERDALLVVLAPEVDLRYERLFAYLHDDVTRKRPSVDLVLNLLCADFAAKLATRTCFSAGAPLLRHRLLETIDDPSRPSPPLLGRALKMDDRLVDYLLGGDPLDVRLLTCAEVVEPRRGVREPPAAASLEGPLRELAAGPWQSAPAEVIYLQGPSGGGRREAAEAVCRARGLALLVVHLDRLPAGDDGAFRAVVELALREAALRGAVPYWNAFDRLLAEERAPQLQFFLAALAGRAGLAFLAGEVLWEAGSALGQARFVRLELAPPEEAERAALWRRCLGRPRPSDDGLLDLASRFRLTGGRIRDAAATARSLAARRGAKGGRPSLGDLAAACRIHSRSRLSPLAQKIEPRYRWRDIVLPADALAQLREIGHHVRHRARVHGEWGFEEKLARGRGINVLFAGPSGTGKTMAAEILAGELGLELYRIDLAAVVSKYIGETEKNLSRIFDEAEAANAILFFDEADALFGKRSKVRDSHDRYANVEVAYLLQRMETYSGVAILATNLAENLDEAFARRMRFRVEFSFPDAARRRRIWEGVLPDRLPRGEDVDLDFLARRFEITGGNIRNIVLAGAFLAAADGGRLGMDHLLHATRREYQKLGRMAIDGEFER